MVGALVGFSSRPCVRSTTRVTDVSRAVRGEKSLSVAISFRRLTSPRPRGARASVFARRVGARVAQFGRRAATRAVSRRRWVDDARRSSSAIPGSDAARTARDASRVSFECVDRCDANDALGESSTRFRRARDNIIETAFVQQRCQVCNPFQ